MKIDKILVPATLSHFTATDCTGTRPFCIFAKMFVTCFTGQNFTSLAFELFNNHTSAFLRFYLWSVVN